MMVDVHACRALVTDEVAYPNGFANLGLAAPSGVLPSWTSRASSARLRTTLERFERAHESPRFEAARLEQVESPFAFELAHVYMALRAKFPAVYPDLLEFKSPYMRRAHVRRFGALATSYAVWAAKARTAAIEHGVRNVEELAEVLNVSVRSLVVELYPEYWYYKDRYSRPRDITTSGRIMLSEHATSPYQLRAQKADSISYWENASTGRFTPVAIRKATSYSTYLFCHEFGHLVDGELLALGFDAAEHVYGELSAALFDIPHPRVSRWGRHLLNLPGQSSWFLAGPYTGSHARQRARRATLLPMLAAQIGRYQQHDRNEMFAESFALSFTAFDVDLRARLVRFHEALADVGLMRRRAIRRPRL